MVKVTFFLAKALPLESFKVTVYAFPLTRELPEPDMLVGTFTNNDTDS